MKFKMQLSIIKLTIFVLFNLFYVIPLISSYLHNGVVFSGNLFFYLSPKINTFGDVLMHLSSYYSNYINVFLNPIFIFFVSAFFFQKACKWIKTL